MIFKINLNDNFPFVFLKKIIFLGENYLFIC